MPPDQREANKSSGERAEDIAYTINHAIACTATDALEPYLDNWFQKKLGMHFPLGCGHDHTHDPHHHDHNHGNLWRWYAGELVGDFGAVPITVAAQRYAPGFMNGLRQLMEPLLGALFRAGAKWSAESWAKKQGMELHSQECKDKQEQIYEHEVSHLPQALLWTASSVTLNLCTQKLLGNKGALWQMATAKLMGSSLNTGLVVGARALVPQSARSWDQFTSRTVFIPATKMIGGAIGIKEEEVDRMNKQAQNSKDSLWVNRINTTEDVSAAAKITG